MSNSKDRYENLSVAMIFAERLPYRFKKEHNFRWAELRADSIDRQYGDSLGKPYLQRVEDNYRLLNGDEMKYYAPAKPTLDGETFTKAARELKEEGISIADNAIEHFDFVSPIIYGKAGDQQRRKLRFVATDSSGYTQNYIKNQRQRLITDYVQANFIQPATERATKETIFKYGLRETDLGQLPPEAQEQLKGEISQRTQELTPADIQKFLSHGHQGIREEQGQMLAETLVKQTDFKFLTDQNYLHSHCTGGEVYAHDLVNGKAVFRRVILENFNTGGSRENSFIDENDWFKEVRYMHPAHVLDEYSQSFKEADWDRFEGQLGFNAGPAGREDDDQKGGRFVANLDLRGKMALTNTNLLTREGQRQYGPLLDHYTGADYKHNDIRVVRVVWASQKKMLYVKRKLKNGDCGWEWHSEGYKFNAASGDVKIHIKWVKEYWEATCIGDGEDKIWVNKRPVPFQFPGLASPFGAQSPYTGGFFYWFNGSGDLKAPLDRAKRFIHAINVQMKRIKEREATDIGKVMLMHIAAKPKNWSWRKFIEIIRAVRVVPLNLGKAGLTANDAQFFKSIDLSNMYDILPRIQYLQFLIQKMAETLLANQASQAQAPASTSVTNNLQNLQRYQSLTSNVSAWHDKILEKLINKLVDLGRASVKEGNVYMRYLLSDYSIAEIDLDPELLASAKIYVWLVSDESEIDKVEMSKNILQPLIQAGMINLATAVDLMWADSKVDIKNIATEADIRAEMQAAAQRDLSQTSEQEQAQFQKDLIELKAQLDWMKAKDLEGMKSQAKMYAADKGASVIALGADVNANSENDYLEDGREDRRSKEALERERLRAEDRWHQDKVRLEREAMRSKEKIAASKPKPPKPRAKAKAK